MLALIDRLVAEGVADRAAVHVAGHSNGGILALRLGCEAADRFRSLAAVNANLPAGLACPEAGPPIATLFVHGAADPFMPYQGGPVGPNGRLGRVLSAEASVSAFARRNGCTAPESRTLAPGDDGMRATVMAYGACRGAPLAHVVVAGSGHGWPGSLYGPRMARVLGPTSRSFSATKAIADFFLERKLP